jgi:hypothetical protein
VQQDEDEHAANKSTPEQRESCEDAQHLPFWIADAAVSANRVAQRIRHGYDYDAENDLLRHEQSAAERRGLSLVLVLSPIDSPARVRGQRG